MWLKQAFLLIYLGCVQAKTSGKSSLTFVIDDTRSMNDDIDQVKKYTNLVFDAVLNSNETKIDNFILVTFNDPYNKVWTITKDRATFKSALDSVYVHNVLNIDCPENSMGGIEKALEVSHPSSYIYVFTDATAKDYEKLEAVQNMAVKLQSRVEFLLTGHCSASRSEPDYAAYYALSKATAGKVFHMNKSNVGQILKYISDTIASDRIPLVDKKLPPGHQEVKCHVDTTMEDINIILTGEHALSGVEVYKPNGTKAKTDVLVDIPGNLIVKVATPVPGNYLARVDTDSDLTLSITGKSSFDFRHGFSIMKPSSLNATSTQPIAGKNSHILIQLETPDEHIELQSIDIVDLDNNITIYNFDTMVLDEATKTYFAERFLPPSYQFKIAIIAHNNKTGETIRRYSKPIEPQKPELIKALPRSPTVEIVEGSEVTVSYKKPFKLTCKVNGYPAPSIVWENLATGHHFGYPVLEPFEPPYDFVGVLDLSPVTSSQQYRCIATINGVTATKDVKVVLEHFFKVVEKPKDVYQIPYNDEVTIPCNVTAYPPVTTTWYLNNTILKGNGNVVVSDDKLTIKHMKPYLRGRYRCSIKNDLIRDDADFKIYVTGFERPIIDQRETTVSVLQGSDAKLTCKVLSGMPTPKMKWTHLSKKLDDYEQHDSNSSITIRNVQPELSGKIKCEARNEAGYAQHYLSLNVEFPPTIKNHTTSVNAREGTSQMLYCQTNGNPTPHVIWRFNGRIVVPDRDHQIYRDHSLKIKASMENSGKYTCEASNKHGTAIQSIDVNYILPPTIKNHTTSVNAREGTSQMLYCQTNGNPAPHVIWRFNGKIVVPDRDHQIYRDHSLKIKASMENSGKYTCEASNKHGTATQSIDVNYILPVSIRIPVRSTINTMVKEDVRLRCHASGYPETTLEWIFRSSDRPMSPKIIRTNSSGTLTLKNLQLNADGFYTCQASNIDGSTNITYKVIVNGPPKIVNVDKSTIYRAVEGDMVLRIPCKAEGRPKPDITWSFNNFNIAKGTERYDIEDDGTLVIKNVDIKARGYHRCKATNHFGSDQKYFYVDVSLFPNEDDPSSSVVVEEGQRSVVNCSLPIKFGSLRWFKNGKLLTKGPLVIDQASVDDSGVYTCRVSTIAGSKSASVEVIVTSLPEFQTEPKTTLLFEDNSYVELDCMNYAEPAAKTEWFFNGKKIDINRNTHSFSMHFENIGQYMCVVSNEIGSINRTFIIKPQGCALHIQDDFSGNLPLMVIPYYLSVRTSGNHMYIPKDQTVKLSCPTEFTTIPKPEITAICKEGTEFYVGGNVLKFSDLNCTSKRIPEVKRKGFRCGHAYTEIVEVGFTTGRTFSPVYEVCVDKKKSIPVFTKLILNQVLAGVDPKDSIWFKSVYVPFDFESMYQCDRQKVEISRTLNKYFHDRDACCFGRRQLISPKDVMPGLSQMATYSNLNVVPQWSTCNAENWNDMEERIRSLAKASTDKLLVWTGQADQLSLPDSSSYHVNVTITDGSRNQAVPKYLWKIIEDPVARASVAIVQVNIPDLRPEDASKHVLCYDVCESIHWMKGGSWRDVTKGYTYCCRIRDFENAFDYRNKFRSGDNLLSDSTYISTHSLVV